MMNKTRMATYYKCSECGEIFYDPMRCPKCKSKKFKKYRQKQRTIITK
jgi:rubrerythrin